LTAEQTDKGHLSIGDVLELLIEDFPDVTISKIRFLESKGLISPERTPSGYRRFYHSDVERLKSILLLQREHYLPLDVIKSRLDKNHLYNVATHAQLSLSFFTPEEEIDSDQNSKKHMNGTNPTESSVRVGLDTETLSRKYFSEEKISLETTDEFSGVNDVFRNTENSKYADESDELSAVDVDTADSRRLSQYHIQGPISREDGTATNNRNGNSLPLSTSYAATSKAVPKRGSVSAVSQKYIYNTAPVSNAAKDPVSVEPSSDSYAADIVSITNRDLNSIFTDGVVKDCEEISEPSAKKDNRHDSADIKQVFQSENGFNSNGIDTGQSSNFGLQNNFQPIKKSVPGKKPAASKEGNDAKLSGRSTGKDVSAATQSVGSSHGFSDAPILPTTYSKEELIVAAEIDTQLFMELMEYGLIKAKKIAGEQLFGDRDVNVAKIISSYSAFGIGPRHLRSLKHAAEREISMYQQTIMPLLRQRNPDSRHKATGNMELMAQLGKELKDLFLRMEMDDIFGASNL